MAHEMIQAQKKQFAKDIIQKLTDIKKKTEETKKDTERLKQAVKRSNFQDIGQQQAVDTELFGKNSTESRRQRISQKKII